MELDTDFLVRFVDSGKDAFVKPLSELSVLLLLLGFREEQMLRKDVETKYQKIVPECPDAPINCLNMAVIQQLVPALKQLPNPLEILFQYN